MNKTTKLNSGVEVLAHKDGHAKTYVNFKQAKQAAEKSGGNVYQGPSSRVFFVMFSHPGFELFSEGESR